MYVNTPSPTNALPCFTSGWVCRETLSLDGENRGERRKVGVREGGRTGRKVGRGVRSRGREGSDVAVHYKS